MKWGLLFFVLVLFSFSISEAKSLRELAIQEARYEGQYSKSATNAQVAGMLNLKDPRPEIITRRWNYFAAFTLQSFQSEGLVTKEGIATFDLTKNKSTLMPSIEAGILTPLLPTQYVIWQLGLRTKASFATQESSLTMNSGYRVDNVRLNTTLLSAGPLLSLRWKDLKWLSVNISPQYGNLSYTQTSPNDFVTFSKSASFDALSFGMEMRLNPKWAIFSEWSQRKIKSTTELALQKNNFEMGAKLTW